MNGTSQDQALEIAPVEQALRFSVGAASPLWLVYGGVAMAGLAYWSLARWSQAGRPELQLSAPPVRMIPPPLRVVQAEPEPDDVWPTMDELAQLAPVEISAEEALTRPSDELAEEAGEIAAEPAPAPKPKKRKTPPTAH